MEFGKLLANSITGSEAIESKGFSDTHVPGIDNRDLSEVVRQQYMVEMIGVVYNGKVCPVRMKILESRNKGRRLLSRGSVG